MLALARIADQPYPIWICDLAEQHILACNDAACRVLGMTLAQVSALGPADLSILPDRDFARIGPAGHDVDLRREEIVWQGQPARAISAFFRPHAVLVAPGATAEQRYAQMKRAMIRAGCVPIEADDETGRVTLTPEIRAMWGLSHDSQKASLAELLTLIHPQDVARYQAARRTSAETGEITEITVRFVRPSGEIRHIKVIAGTDLDHGGRRFGLLQDVTDAVQAAERADRSQAIIAVASDIAKVGGWRRDIATERLEVTEGISRIFAMPEGTFDLQAFFGCFDPAGRAEIIHLRERVHQERVEIAGEYPITACDGVRKRVRIRQRPVIAADGQVIAVVGAVQDVSDIFAVRQEADALALRVANMVENLPDGFLLLDRDMRLTYANPKAEQFIGYAQGPNAVYLGRTLWDVFPLVASQLRPPMTQLLVDGQSVSFLLEVPSTQAVRKVAAFLTPDGIGVHVRDVTAEVQGQRSLHASEERYRLALKASQDVVFDWQVAADSLTWSEAGQPRFGYDPQTFPRCLADWVSILHPADRARMEAQTESQQSPLQKELLTSEYRLRRADGSWARVLDRSISLPGSDGRPARMIGTITDVTALREEEERLRAIVDVAADGIYEYDPKRNTVFYSEGLRSVFGYDWVGVQTIPTPWQAAVHPDDRQALLADFDAFCAGDAGRWRREYRMARADGSFAIVREKAVAVRDEDGKLVRVIGSIEDVTQQRRTEERVRQAERIESIGQLTGGVAHDFNNLLTIILGSADLLQADKRLTEGERELASVIIRAAERGAELTAGLLAFAGRQPLAPKSLDTSGALSEVRRLLERTLPANIDLQVISSPGLWLVEADPAQLNAALLNLAVNARDAMPGGGKLLIECSNARLDAAYAERTPDARPGDFLRIAVTDTGTGMTPQVVARAFEPFFTTKARGSGTGMGLSMVRGFTQQSGGHVTIYTEAGHGTTVSLYLPRSRSSVAEILAEPEITHLGGRGEHVLIVEDNPLLLAHAAEIVGGLGYRTSVAADATEALAILAQTQDIDLLFTDVVLPGDINGAKLAKLAVAAQPDLKVLFTSGYTENAIIHQGRLDPGVELLSKPYRRNELARRFREILEKTT